MLREPGPLDHLAKENSVLDVFPLATKVAIKLNHDADGYITGISLRANGYTQYEISYFINGEYKAIWLQEFEFTVINGEKHKIGFK